MGANLTDAHLFCLLACDRDSCCDGFILTQVKAGMADWRAGLPRGMGHLETMLRRRVVVTFAFEASTLIEA